MATSRPWFRRVGEYLGSNRNIVGSMAGMAALGATVPTGIAGPFWPVVVGGVYGIGALLTPQDKVHLVDSGYSAAVARAENLRSDLDQLSAKVRHHERRLPDDVIAAYLGIESRLREILARAEELATSPDHLFVVGRTINEYLPTSLETYANLPRSFALGHRGDNQRTAHEELLGQLALLDRELDEIATAVYAGDVAKLSAQGRFLEDKFADSSLDLRGISFPPQDIPRGPTIGGSSAPAPRATQTGSDTPGRLEPPTP